MVYNSMHIIQYYKIFFSFESVAFFIDEPSKKVKIFPYRALLTTVRSKKLVTLAIVSSSVAKSILLGNQIENSRFKILLNLDKNSTFNVSKQSRLGKLLDWLYETKYRCQVDCY